MTDTITRRARRRLLARLTHGSGPRAQTRAQAALRIELAIRSCEGARQALRRTVAS